MNLPISAAEDHDRIEKIEAPPVSDAYIPNIYVRKETLTREEALNQINMLSGALLADGCFRG